MVPNKTDSSAKYALQAPVVAYVTEEVHRQGHDVTQLDGIQRVCWMLEAWCEALDLLKTKMGKKPTIQHAELLGRLIEPAKNDEGFRVCGVRVGPRVCPAPERVPSLLIALWLQRDALTPMEFYKEFEGIHPFVDGNGRTGKILLNWLNGTLLAPIFPPADLFGYPIQNP